MSGWLILASLSLESFRRFFSEVNGYLDVLPAIRLVNPALGYAELARQINATQAGILLTGWDSVPLPEFFCEECPSVRYICHLTGGLRWMLPRVLIEKGLQATNWGSVISDNVAEGALFLILACTRRAAHAALTMHARKGWELALDPPVSLLDKRVGIHGFGNVAQQLALLLRPFRCRVSSYSPPVPNEIFELCHAEPETSLEHLFSRNDVVVELEALTPHTVGMVGLELLERIRPGGVFVNAGRGKVVCEADLVEVARREKIYIGLDVYEQEPLPVDSPLRGLENVFLVPHQAGPTPDRYPRLAEHALSNLRAYLQGRKLQDVIGLVQYDRMT